MDTAADVGAKEQKKYIEDNERGSIIMENDRSFDG